MNGSEKWSPAFTELLTVPSFWCVVLLGTQVPVYVTDGSLSSMRANNMVARGGRNGHPRPI